MPLELDVLKRYLDLTKTVDDDLLQMELNGVLAFAAGPLGTGRQLTLLPDTTEVTRPVRARWIRVPDATAVTAVTIDGVAITDYDLVYNRGTIVQLELGYDAPSGWATCWPPARRSRAVVTGTFGMTDIPDDLAVAIYKHTARAWKERESLYGDQVALEDGSVVNYFRTMPPFVKAVYDSYRIASDWTVLA